MRRREFLWGLLGASVSFFARAAEGRVYRLGMVVQSPRSRYDAFFNELRRNGFVEGDNLLTTHRGFETSTDRVDGVAVEVANMAPDAIFCAGDAASVAVQRTGTKVPVVVLTDDIIRTGLVASLARPEGTITGVTIFAHELDRKRFEILTEMIPGLRRVGVLSDPGTTGPDQLEAVLA